MIWVSAWFLFQIKKCHGKKWKQTWLQGPGDVTLYQQSMFAEGWAQDCSNSNIFLKPLFRGKFDPFVNNANLGAIAHTSNGT